MPAVETMNSGQRCILKPVSNVSIPPIQARLIDAFEGALKVQVEAGHRARLAQYRANLTCALVWDDHGRSSQESVMVDQISGSEISLKVSSGEERREFPRVHTTAMFTYEIVPPEQVERAAEEIQGSVPDSFDATPQVERLWHVEDDTWEKLDEEFHRMSHQIAQLNSKLDCLIALAEGRSAPSNVQRHRELVDFSGSGLCFNENPALEKHAILRLSIELSRFPRQEVHCLGEVVRVQPIKSPGSTTPNNYEVGVHFTVINDDDRERIIRHIFRVQRCQLRNRKNLE